MKPNHRTFIIEMIKHGDKELAWQRAHPGNKGGISARSAANRLLRRHPEIAAEIQEAIDNIRDKAYSEAYQLFVEQQRTPLLNMMKRREILARIATREVKVCRNIRVGDRIEMVFEDIHPREMIKAMEVDVKFEEICNRLRSIHDPVSAQFNIYIDGRPGSDRNTKNSAKKNLKANLAVPLAQDETDNPTTTIPTGRQTLPQTGDTNNTSPLGRGWGGPLAQDETDNPTTTIPTGRQTLPQTGDTNNTSPLGRGWGGPLAQDENNNTTTTLSTGSQALPQTGDTNNTSPLGRGWGGSLAQDENDNPTTTLPTGRQTLPQTDNTNNTSPLGRGWGGPLAQDENNNTTTTLIKNPGDKCPALVIPETSPLYNQYLHLLEKQKLREKDILYASFQQEQKRLREQAPPPRILTDEEARQYIIEHSTPGDNPIPSNFGKMYFPEKNKDELDL